VLRMPRLTGRQLESSRISLEEISAFARRIGERFHPERIILFGSYAYGSPTADSDVDLLVIMKTRRREIDQAVEIRLALDAPFPLDLMVRRPQTIRRRIAQGDCFLREIITRGKVVYESPPPFILLSERDIRTHGTMWHDSPLDLFGNLDR
jgi:predicted nucleotidyltransferase